MPEENKIRKKLEKKHKVPAHVDTGENLSKIFSYKSGDGFVDKIYHGGDFQSAPVLVDVIYLRLDDALANPLSISVNEQEFSALINNEYQVNFVDAIGEQSFFNDLFFYIEELHNTPPEKRGTSIHKEIRLIDELEIFNTGEQHEQKLDDTKTK